MRSRYRNSRKLLRKNIAYTAGIAVGLAVLGYAALTALRQPQMDEVGCYEQDGQKQSVILVDASEPRWNEEQARSIHNHLDRVWETLAFNERLRVFTTEGDISSSVLKPRFWVCGQATSAEDLRSIGAQTATKSYLAQEKAQLYEQIFKPEIQAIFKSDPGSERRQNLQSPILESLQDISRHLSPETTITVISDMIQNSEVASFCSSQGHMPHFAEFAARPNYQLVKPEDFQGAVVEILFLQRQGYGAGSLSHCSGEAEILRFWSDYFMANGASDIRVNRIRLGFSQR